MVDGVDVLIIVVRGSYFMCAFTGADRLSL